MTLPPSAPPGNDKDQATEGIIVDFLRALYPTYPANANVSLWVKQTKASVHLPISDPGAIARTALEISGSGEDCYFGVGLRRAGLPPEKRGSSADVVALPGYWVDVDILSPVHAAKNLPPDQDAALSLIDEAYEEQPSLVVNSGYGLHAYWIFNSPWVIGAENRGEATRLLKAHQRLVIRAAAAKALHVDNTADLARVLRVPCTRNCKVPS